MRSKTTNFFEISVQPEIKELYLTDNGAVEDFDAPDNLSTHFDKNSAISLYPYKASRKVDSKPQYVEWLLKRRFFKILEENKSIFDINYRDGEVTILDENLLQKEEYSLLRRLVARIFYAKGKLLLAIDPITKIYNRLSLAKLIGNYKFSSQEFISHNDCLVFIEQRGVRKWARGRIRDIIDPDTVKVEVPSLFDGTIEVSSSRVIPSYNKTLLAQILKKSGHGADFDKEVKQLSDFTSKEKLETIQHLFREYLQTAFPILIRDTSFTIAENPLSADIFPQSQIPSQSEPQYIVTRDNLPIVKSHKRLNALSQIEMPLNKVVEQKVVLFATRQTVNVMERIINQLNQGVTRGNYKFSFPSKFGIKLQVVDRFITSDYSDYNLESDRFLMSNEEKHRDALPLIYLPPLSEIYYPLKAKFAYFARVSQVISKPTFDIYALWNLATNLFAKFGYEPWGISIDPTKPNADIVLGLAFSSLKREGRLKRNIGYVNVFDKNGVWLFVQSSSGYVDFDNRLRSIPQMMRNAVLGFTAGGSNPQIIDIHYTKRFSYQERKRIYEAIKGVAPNIKELNFISLDKTHPLRVFDMSNNNLNFSRGGIVQLNHNEFLLSIAGESHPSALASRLLKVQVWREPWNDEAIDVHPIAYRILAMTKLNWRSAVRETTEPVTLRFAEEIARLTNQFSLTDWNTINNRLSNIPWFI